MNRQKKALSVAVGWLSVYALLILSAITATLAVFWRASLTQTKFEAVRVTPAEFPVLVNLALILAMVSGGLALVAGLWHPFRQHRFTFVITGSCITNAAISFLMGNTSAMPFCLGIGTTLVLFLGLGIKRRLARGRL